MWPGETSQTWGFAQQFYFEFIQMSAGVCSGLVLRFLSIGGIKACATATWMALWVRFFRGAHGATRCARLRPKDRAGNSCVMLASPKTRPCESATVVVSVNACEAGRPWGHAGPCKHDTSAGMQPCTWPTIVSMRSCPCRCIVPCARKCRTRSVMSRGR